MGCVYQSLIKKLLTYLLTYGLLRAALTTAAACWLVRLAYCFRMPQPSVAPSPSVKIWLRSVKTPQIFNWRDPRPPLLNVDLSIGDIRWQIAAEWLEIAQWSQWKALDTDIALPNGTNTVTPRTPLHALAGELHVGLIFEHRHRQSSAVRSVNAEKLI